MRRDVKQDGTSNNRALTGLIQGLKVIKMGGPNLEIFKVSKNVSSPTMSASSIGTEKERRSATTRPADHKPRRIRRARGEIC